MHDLRFARVLQRAASDVPVDGVPVPRALFGGMRYFVGVHGWTVGLFFCSVLAFIMQSVPFGMLLVIVFVAVWIPDSRINMASRIGALVVATLLATATFLFNTVANATTIEQVPVFVYLGLETLYPFVAYIVAAAVCIFTLALHWRWRTKEHSRDHDLWFWVQEMLPGQERVSDELQWRDGTLICELLRAMRPESRALSPHDNTWPAALACMETEWDLLDVDPRELVALLARLRMRAASLPRVAGIWLLIHSYVLAYVFVFMASVVQVSILNAVYLGFFLVLLFWRRPALALWAALVAYTQIDIVVQFFWQFPYTESLRSPTTDLIGLVKFDSVWTGLVWQFLTLGAGLMQLYISRYREETNIELRLDMTDARPSTKFVLYGCEWLLQTCLVLAVYLALLLTGLLSVVSLMSLAQLVFLGLLLFVSFVVPASEARARVLKFVWPVLVVWSLLVLLVCFVVQVSGLRRLLLM